MNGGAAIHRETPGNGGENGVARAFGRERPRRGPDRARGPLMWAPMVPLVAAMSLGIVVDRYLNAGTTTAGWAAALIACAMIAALGHRREAPSVLALLAAFVALGGGWHHDRWSDRPGDDLSGPITEEPLPVWARGTVRETLGERGVHRPSSAKPAPESEHDEAEDRRSRFVVDLTAVHDRGAWRPASGRAIAIVQGGTSGLGAGAAVETVGHLARPAGPLNPGEFDYRAFLRAEGIDLKLTVDGPAGIRHDPDGRPDGPAAALGTLREWARSRLTGQIDPAIEPLASAFLLGRREEVAPEVNDAFARTGTMHLIAISGLHLQALAFGLLAAALFFRVPRRPAYLGVAVLTCGYAVLVGLAPSVTRSAIMTLTFCLAALANRSARSANTLALAGLGTLAYNPSSLFDVGCQLSFLAIAALFWLAPPVRSALGAFLGSARDRARGPRTPLDELEAELAPRWRIELREHAEHLADGLITSAVVWLAALPLVALKFHLVAPIGVLLNLPLIPLTSLALMFGGLGLVLSALWGPLGAPAIGAAGRLLELTEGIVRWGVAQPWGHHFTAGPSWAWVLVFVALLALAAMAATAEERSPEPGRRARLGPWCALGLWSVGGLAAAYRPTRPNSLEADVLAVGHGLAIVVRAPDGATLLYDCGRMHDPGVGRRTIAPALWALGVSRIDTVILSHADQDHYNGLSDLLDRFAIGTVRVAPGFGGPANPRAVALLKDVRARGIAVEPTAAPAFWSSDDVRFTVLHPPGEWPLVEVSDNARSLVLDVEYRGRHLLLTGDIELEGLDALLQTRPPEPPPEILLAPHHGGRSANPPALYDWAGPMATVVSRQPPPPDTRDPLAFLKARGARLLETSRAGAVHLRWAENEIVAVGFRSGPM